MLLAENISFRLLQLPLSSCVVSDLVPISFGVFESFQGMYVHVKNIRYCPEEHFTASANRPQVFKCVKGQPSCLNARPA